MSTVAKKNLQNIPSGVDSGKTLRLVKSGKYFSDYFNFLKLLSKESDEAIARWLNIDVKSFKTYQHSKEDLKKPVLLEHVIMLISLFKHGYDIFGTPDNFKTWLNQANFYFDKKSPSHFLDTISGIRFIDDRLTALEFGDNA